MSQLDQIMEEYKKDSYSDDLLEKYKGKKMTLHQRQELREAYNYEQEQEEKEREKALNSVKDFKDDTFHPLDMPRHRWLNKNSRYEECPICFRIRGYNTSYLSDYNDITNYPDDFCKKPEIHNEKTFAMMIRRERVDLDESRKRANHTLS